MEYLGQGGRGRALSYCTVQPEMGGVPGTGREEELHLTVQYSLKWVEYLGQGGRGGALSYCTVQPEMGGVPGMGRERRSSILLYSTA